MEQNHQITLSEWAEMKEAIRRELSNVKHAFVRVGYYLRRAEDDKLYMADGFKTLSEFAEKEYGLGASTVSRLIAINRKFSVEGYSPQLLPEYDGFKQSVLTEMLALPSEDMQMVTPETPREAVRELVRFNRQDPQETEGEWSSFLRDFLRDDPDTAKSLQEQDPQAEKEIREIVNPAGSRVYRKGVFFMAMSETDVKLKRIGGKPEAFTYRDFLEMAGPALEELQAEKADAEENCQTADESYQATEESDHSTEENDQITAENAQITAENAQNTAESSGQETDEEEENNEQEHRENREDTAEEEERQQGDAETAEGDGEDDQGAEEDVSGDDGEDEGSGDAQEPDDEGAGGDDRRPGLDQETAGQAGEGTEDQEGQEETEGGILGGSEEPEAPGENGTQGDRGQDERCAAETADIQEEDGVEDSAEPCGTIIAKRTIRLQKMIFEALEQGLTDSILTADAGVRVGDTVELMSFENGRYVGSQARKKVKYLLSGAEGLEKGYCLMTLC